MDQAINQILFALLRSAVCGEPLSEQQRAELSDEGLEELTVLARKHDLLHLVALGLQKNALIGADHELRREIFAAAIRCEQLQHELKKLSGVLEEAEIPFLPLKGSVIRGYYPEPWMRTSCDIDVLVSAENVERASALLVEQCGYTRGGKGSHDITLFTKHGWHVELHYDLVEEGLAVRAADVLRSVWDTATVCDGYCYRYEMPDEMFYFYHVAHMAKHFENGGCGIRPFIDLWILDGLDGADAAKRNVLLEQGGLLRFAEVCRKLSRVWFGGEAADPICERVEAYLLYGGVYGATENRIAVGQQKKGGALRFALSRVFLPYDVIKFHYPILQKHKWLLPAMQVRRWGKLIFRGGFRRGMKELQYNQSIDGAKADETASMLRDIGLL